MEIKLNLEQIAYLKSLDSKKKKRKFLLDCLIENVEISKIEMHFSYAQKPIEESDEVIVLKKITELLIEENKELIEKSIEKPNYSPEEIELAKHNIHQREISEQGSELLKFDMLEDEFWQTQKENEKLKKKINKQNVILDQFDIQEDKDIKSHEYCNTIINFSNLIVKCVNMQSDPTNILNQFLLSVNKYYHYKTSKTIDFIDELFPQLKDSEIAK